jgi:hypothetical protein
MQPVLTHVPPNRPRSIMATRWPAATIRTARNGPDCPVPMTIASKLFVMIGDHPRFTPLKVDLDVASRPRAADQHVSFGGRLKRPGQIVDRTADQSTFAGMTHPRSAGPPHRHIARLREIQSTEPHLRGKRRPVPHLTCVDATADEFVMSRFDVTGAPSAEPGEAVVILLRT